MQKLCIKAESECGVCFLSPVAESDFGFVTATNLSSSAVLRELGYLNS